MLLSAPTAVIYIDTNTKTVNFVIADSGDASKLACDSVGYTTDTFDDGFFSEFRAILHEYYTRRKESFDKTVLILPDRLFITDTVSVPTAGWRTSSASLSTAVASLYKNYNEIKFNTYPIRTDNGIITYCLVGIRRELIEKFRQCCDADRVSVKAVTFASNAAVNAALDLSASLRGTDFLLLDIKNSTSHFAFVGKGQTLGYYSLPFGHDVLRTAPSNDGAAVTNAFRVFVKWTLELLSCNPAIIGTTETVVVNLPSAYRHILDDINAELADCKIRFRPLSEHTSEIPLEIFGGMLVKQYNKNNNF